MNKEKTNIKDKESNKYAGRVDRGGGWPDGEEQSIVNFKDWDNPYFRRTFQGFRLVLQTKTKKK